MTGFKYAVRAVVVVLSLVFFVKWGWNNLLIEGINGVVDGAKADPTDAGSIAWGLIKLVLILTFLGLIFWGSILMSMLITGSSDNKRPPRRKTAKQVNRDYERRMGR